MNWIAFRTLFIKEVKRFQKVWMQTVLAPLMTNSLYFLVFGVALGSRLKEIDGVPYIAYVVPGLMMLSMLRNAFLNTSSSLFQSKLNNTIQDILVAPIGSLEILVAYVVAAWLRACVVGSMVYLVAYLFVDLRFFHFGWAFFFATVVSMAFACFGLLIALWARKFDHLTIIPNFVLAPMTFLGGVFYSIRMLPTPWDQISLANPILYMVNGMRYGMLGITDVPLWQAVVVSLGFLAIMVICTIYALTRGYNLRS